MKVQPKLQLQLHLQPLLQLQLRCNRSCSNSWQLRAQPKLQQQQQLKLQRWRFLDLFGRPLGKFTEPANFDENRAGMGFGSEAET